MDTFAVAIAAGTCRKTVPVRKALKMALFFGLIHIAMPLLGWSGGQTLTNFISTFDHWLAFLLLTFVGGKMLWESRHQHDERPTSDPFETKYLTLLAVATSLDALATGLSFSFLNISIVPAALIIGASAFSFTFFGVYAGIRFGKMLAQRAEALGGLILIGIGIKIMTEHL